MSEITERQQEEKRLVNESHHRELGIIRTVGWIWLLLGMGVALDADSWRLALLVAGGAWGLRLVGKFYRLMFSIEADLWALLAAEHHTNAMLQYWHERAIAKLGEEPPAPSRNR